MLAIVGGYLIKEVLAANLQIDPAQSYKLSTTCRIGERVDAGSDFKGYVDEVRIYNRVLSADEVMQHYK